MKIVFTTQGNLSVKNNEKDYYLLTAIGFEYNNLDLLEGRMEYFLRLPEITPDTKIEGDFKSKCFDDMEKNLPHFFKYIYVDKKAITDKAIFEDREALQKQIFQVLIESVLPLIPYYNDLLFVRYIPRNDPSYCEDLVDFERLLSPSNNAFVYHTGGYYENNQESLEKYLDLVANDILAYHQGKSEAMVVQKLLREPIIINQSSFDEEGILKNITKDFLENPCGKKSSWNNSQR